ncbi:hypothetical protein AB0I10_16805 [Streptomyces sp. NPDC050636]|uniref:hypothetical protein n=1 Tax=Streptomyces sp. NPDC050636 TaxID=3154510 RepID=UPI003425FE98
MPAPSSSGGGDEVDVVSLMRDDPKVGDYVKKSLAAPCAADAYPVEVSYASLTGGKSRDVIVNVLTCADSVGIGSYVYRRDRGAPGGYENVFADEQPSVSAAVNNGELETSTQTYKAGDKVGYPSGEDVTIYRWADGRFTRRASHYTDYSKTTVNGVEPDDGTGSEG